MKGRNRINIGITMGDPSGIGPEIILRSFTKPSIRNKRIIVIGDFIIMESAFKMLKITSFKLNRLLDAGDCEYDPGILNILDIQTVEMDRFTPGIINAFSGNAAFEYIRKAVDLARERHIEAIVTAPVSKEALHLAGHNYPGHTEILATLTDTRDYAMFLYDKKLSIIHVSTHVPLLEAIRGLKRERIEKVIELAYDLMKKLGKDEPRIAVSGINPHAGENGLFGDEEIKVIAPAVKNMAGRGFRVEGPLPPDTVFLQALKGKYDVVAAMYHDQGHIPLKLLGFDRGVNITAGLPFVRTSVDHGTAFDIAWHGIAHEGSMVEAIKLAWKLTR